MKDNSSLQYAYDCLKRKNEATGFAAEKLNEENNKLRLMVDIVEKKNIQLIKKLNNKDKVIKIALDRVNAQNNEYLKEIERLRREIEKCLLQ